ncbi:hypothetical protein SAMN06265784_10834 [Paraburkholderia susongensis]|uniref:Uncharacterized protein n=1 Tax=Paraburkholderia susongensis TaxID=1515439 RepID=A0A1X7LQE9_9BURK|nr:hypothetical protein SAMN06265784_10834 [Paraburkholderia susongensis]
MRGRNADDAVRKGLPHFFVRARPMRSQARNAHTPATLISKRMRRHHESLARCHAIQFANNRMWQHSSCMTGSNVSMSSGGKRPERRASSKRPNAKKLSTHSL